MTEIKKQTPPEEIVKDTVTIPKDQFKHLVETVTEMKEKQEFLESVADKKAVANWYKRHREKLPVHVRLRTLQDKVIIGWRTIKNEVYKDLNTNRWVENQEIEVMYEDGETQTMPYATFSTQYDSVKCERVAISEDSEGGVTLKLKRLDNGKLYEVGVQFVN